MKSVLKPTSWPATPSQSRWEWTRSSSATAVRIQRARGGITRPMASSIPFVKVVAWEWEQMPQIRSRRGMVRAKSRPSAAFSMPRWL